MLACATFASIVRNFPTAAAQISSLDLCTFLWAVASSHGAVEYPKIDYQKTDQ